MLPKGADLLEIDCLLVECRGAVKNFAREPALIRQSIQTDEQRIPGKSRVTLIRRFAEPGRSQRQDLPEALFALG